MYIVIILGLFLFHHLFLRLYKELDIFKLTMMICFLLFFSYPFLSHDLFSYMFDAKIFTEYHQNPYLHRPMEYTNDPWLRFMHWTHRTYPYGPSFLILTLLPSVLGFGKFILTFFAFKLLFVAAYLGGVYALNKVNKKWAIIFATHPLVLIEGLISTHNDLIAVSLALLGSYLVLSNKNILGRLLLLLSGGIKYTTLPILFISKNKIINTGIFLSLLLLTIYICITLAIQ
ncbi:MAG TPA: hypothetical protein VK338_02665, partial [Candidatus Nitrosocosmicus sp.]|nr:hypothetical protein [Candidatus Nitrosocosmicus sp.]